MTPNGSAGAIWMSGGGLAADSQHHIFAATGNGTFDASRRGPDYGDSVIKLAAERNGLAVMDYFTPFNQASLDAQDQDLGSGGVLLLPDQQGPHPHLLVVGSKAGTLYVLNRDNLGRFARRGDRIVQELPGASFSIFSTPAYYQGNIYVVGAPAPGTPNDVLKDYRMAGGALAPNPALGSYSYSYPGATPSISANGSTGGIVWTVERFGSANAGGPILRAYDATDVTHELYDSTQVATRDQLGPGTTFAVPTVVNGKVYVGGAEGVTVFGLLH